jgi:hypothetical protein
MQFLNTYHVRLEDIHMFPFQIGPTTETGSLISSLHVKEASESTMEQSLLRALTFTSAQIPWHVAEN